MKNIRTAVLVLLTVALAFMFSKGFVVEDAPPLVQRATRQVLRVWVMESFTGSLSYLSKAATLFEKANPGVSVRLRRAQPQELEAANAVLPDAILYAPGMIAQPQETFLPLDTLPQVRAPYMAAGKWQGEVYGVPIFAGAYCLMTNDALYGGEFTLDGLAQNISPAAKKTAAVYGLVCPADDSLSYPAALLAQGGALLGGFPQGLLSEAAEGVISPKFLNMTRDQAFSLFSKGQSAAILATQKEVRRMSALNEAGKGVEFSVDPALQAFCDQLLLGSVVSGENTQLASELLAFLLKDEQQSLLSGYGFFSVLEGMSIYEIQQMPRLYAMEQSLLSDTLICANAYAYVTAKETLDEIGVKGLSQGGQDLMSVAFY